MLALDLALAGVALGAIAALSGIGLLVTYRTTGVLNLAHGGVAMVVAFLFWQAVRGWGWPVAVAAPLDLAVVAPAIGLLLHRAVFRPLQRRGAAPAESLVASLGVCVTLIGVAFAVWGLGARPDAPALFPSDPVHLPGGAVVGLDSLAELGVVVAVCLVAGAVGTRSRFGADVRAVVDGRQLAELTGVRADRVEAAGWALGSTLAGLTGVLLAPRLQLDPYGLTLLVLETFAVVVVARLRSLPVVLATALALGVGQSELEQVRLAPHPQQLLDALRANLFVVALLLGLLALTRLDELGGDPGVAARFATRGTSGPGPAGQRRRWLLLSVPALLVPLAFGAEDLRSAQQVPALALVFLSLVVVTGYGGQLSLGQAGFAGLGALFATRLVDHGVPGLVALVVGALGVLPVGLATGYPAIRRRGLFLALTTFAVGAVVSRFVFEQPTFVTGLAVRRPALAGLALTGDRGFYLLELACLALGIAVVRILHRGRLGRALLAVRDSEEGARAVGVDVRRLKLFLFAASGVLAGLGGALLAESARAFDPTTFQPLTSLVWFTAVVAFGADSAVGAVLAAALLTAIDTLVQPGASTLAVGLLALLLGRLPGGLAQAARGLSEAAVRAVTTWVAAGGVAGAAGPAAAVGSAGLPGRTAASTLAAPTPAAPTLAASTLADPTPAASTLAAPTPAAPTPAGANADAEALAPDGTCGRSPGAPSPRLSPEGQAVLARVRATRAGRP